MSVGTHASRCRLPCTDPTPRCRCPSPNTCRREARAHCWTEEETPAPFARRPHLMARSASERRGSGRRGLGREEGAAAGRRPRDRAAPAARERRGDGGDSGGAPRPGALPSATHGRPSAGEAVGRATRGATSSVADWPWRRGWRARGSGASPAWWPRLGAHPSSHAVPEAVP